MKHPFDYVQNENALKEHKAYCLTRRTGRVTCPHCNGKSKALVENVQLICHHCLGRGTKYITGDFIVEEVQVTREILYDYIDQIEDEFSSPYFFKTRKEAEDHIRSKRR